MVIPHSFTRRGTSRLYGRYRSFTGSCPELVEGLVEFTTDLDLIRSVHMNVSHKSPKECTYIIKNETSCQLSILWYNSKIMSKIEQFRTGLRSSRVIQFIIGRDGRDTSLPSVEAVDPLKAYKDYAEEKFREMFSRYDRMAADVLGIGEKSIIREIQKKNECPNYELPSVLADKYRGSGFSFSFSPNPSGIRYNIHPHGNPEIAITSGLTTTLLLVLPATDGIKYHRYEIAETIADPNGNPPTRRKTSLFQSGYPVDMTIQNGNLRVSASYSNSDDSGNVSLVDGGIIGGFIYDGQVIVRSFGGIYRAEGNTVELNRFGVYDGVPLPDIVGVPDEVVIRHGKLVNSNPNVVRLHKTENIHQIVDSVISRLDSFAPTTA